MLNVNKWNIIGNLYLLAVVIDTIKPVETLIATGHRTI